MNDDIIRAHEELVRTIDQIIGSPGVELEQNESIQDSFLLNATLSKGLHGNGNVSLPQIRGLLEAFERIIIDNN